MLKGTEKMFSVSGLDDGRGAHHVKLDPLSWSISKARDPRLYHEHVLRSRGSFCRDKLSGLVKN